MSRSGATRVMPSAPVPKATQPPPSSEVPNAKKPRATPASPADFDGNFAAAARRGMDMKNSNGADSAGGVQVLIPLVHLHGEMPGEPRPDAPVDDTTLLASPTGTDAAPPLAAPAKEASSVFER